MSEMNRVLVKVRGSQRDLEGEESVIEMMAEGRHYFKQGKHYVLYNDNTLNTEKDVSTVLKIAADKITLLRNGAVRQSQEFMPLTESRSFYQTPYGTMELTVETEKLKVDFGTVAGTVDLKYRLAVNGATQSHNTLHIEVDCAADDLRHLN